MKEEAQLVALLEFLGWKWLVIWDDNQNQFHQFVASGTAERLKKRFDAKEVKRSDIPEGAEILRLELPRLTLDLMAIAEDKLRKSPDTYTPGGRGYYIQMLEQKLGSEEKVFATKEQRLEALLKTIGKYES